MLLVGICQAQISFTGLHKYDGEHKNEIAGYAMSGYNVVSEQFYGLELSYKHHFDKHWHVGADAQAQFGKQLYSVDVQGGYMFSFGWSDFYVDGKALYNNYHRWNAKEMIGNLSLTWETPYFWLRLGESYIHYKVGSLGYTEPLTLTFGTGVNLRPRWNAWNVGFFFRNFDDFYYENWNINWGLNFYAPITKTMKLFGELNIRPAGSMSQLATRYETSGKLGIKYIW